MKKPYVISEELDIIDAEYIQKNKIETFRESLDNNLRGMGKETAWVDAGALRKGLARYMDQTKLRVVSLDDRYVTSADGWIGISRSADERLNDGGYAARAS